MAKINPAINDIVLEIHKGKFRLEINKHFLSGEKFGSGKSFFEFYPPHFLYNLISEKTFLAFLKKLGKEVIKNNEIENKWR